MIARLAVGVRWVVQRVNSPAPNRVMTGMSDHAPMATIDELRQRSEGLRERSRDANLRADVLIAASARLQARSRELIRWPAWSSGR